MSLFENARKIPTEFIYEIIVEEDPTELMKMYYENKIDQENLNKNKIEILTKLLPKLRNTKVVNLVTDVLIAGDNIVYQHYPHITFGESPYDDAALAYVILTYPYKLALDNISIHHYMLKIKTAMRLIESEEKQAIIA